jgi:hypothetical protein
VDPVLGDASERDELGLDRKPKLNSAGADAELEERSDVYCRTVT